MAGFCLSLAPFAFLGSIFQRSGFASSFCSLDCCSLVGTVIGAQFAFLTFSACIARLSAAFFAAETCFTGFGNLAIVRPFEHNLASILGRLFDSLPSGSFVLYLVLAETF